MNSARGSMRSTPVPRIKISGKSECVNCNNKSKGGEINYYINNSGSVTVRHTEFEFKDGVNHNEESYLCVGYD